MNSPPSEQALAFYSRYYVEYVKLPDLKDSQEKQQELVDAMNRNEPVCCSDDKVNGVCTPPAKRNRVCDDNEKAEEQGDLDALDDGVTSWTNNMKIVPNTEDLVNWMSGSGFGSEGLHGDSELKLDEDSNDELMKPDVVSGLAPPDLVDGAEKLPDVDLGDLTADEDALKTGITNAKRLQISGGGTKYEMTMKKVREGVW